MGRHKVRYARGAVGAAAVVALAATSAVVAFTLVRSPPSSGSRTPAPVTAPAPALTTPVPAPSTTVNAAVAPSVPDHGVYIGAYVQPTHYSVSGKLAALDALQHLAGGRLDIVHSYLRWRVPFPRPDQQAIMDRGSMLLLSWAGTDTRAIASGAEDGWIRRQALAIKAAGKPIFLEWRWEMNRPALYPEVHSPADYVAAWDRIRSIFAQQHVHNVAWVWCPSNFQFEINGASFYPGNNEVDWLCVDVYPRKGPYTSFAALAQPFLAWASHIPKPIMIGEYGAPRRYGPQPRAAWLRGAAQVARLNPQIKALVYFDGDPIKGQGWRRFALDPASPPLLAFRRMAGQSYFDPDRLRVPGRPG